MGTPLPPEQTAHLVLRGIVLGVAALLSMFFSGSETALFSLPADEVRRMAAARGYRGVIAGLLAQPKRLLTTVLFGNMVVNVVFFSVSFLLIVGHAEQLGSSTAALLGLASLVFVIVFCEILPKNLAVTFAHSAGRLSAWPLLLFQRTFFPFIWALERITDRISAAFGSELTPEPFIRAEELEMLIDLSAKEGAVEEDVGEMIAEVMQLSEIAVREVMIPRVDIACFDIGDAPQELRGLFCESKHTLMPVYEERGDNMLGVVHAKDFLLWDGSTPLRELLRPVPFVPETATVENVLQQMREQHIQTAFVVDEYGAVEGLVTAEDLLEEIVGEIRDEFDAQEAPPVERIDERRFRLRGDLSVREWHEAFEMEMPELSVDTIGGLVMMLLQRMPQVGDQVRYRNLNLEVEKTHGWRVVSVILELTGPSDDEQEGDARD